MQLNTILPKKHPLGKTFAVGPNANPETQRLAAEVVGFELGETVTVKLPDPHRGTSPRYHGRSGAVAVINPADIEVGVDLTGTVTWFRTDEVVSL
jgi:ribosomal protein L21E